MATSPASPPKPPKHLSSSARRYWNRTVIEFEFATAAQIALLEELCRTMTRLEEITRTIRKDGLTVTGSRKQVVAHPLLAAEDACRRMIVQLSNTLKLTHDEDK